MDITELSGLIANNGVAVGCLIYFMWYNKKYAEKTNEILTELKAYIEVLLKERDENKGGE